MLRSLIDFFFPPSCAGCGCRLLDGERHVCPRCLAEWPRPHVGDDPANSRFVKRFWSQAQVQSATAVYTYVPGSQLANVVHAMKYDGRGELCRFMGRVMAADERAYTIFTHADALIPVPITEARRKERGYNQSELLCEGISEITGLPIVTTVLRRTSFMGSQTTLTHDARAHNVKNAFALNHDNASGTNTSKNTSKSVASIAGKHVVIIDDVTTTGATILECILTLRSIPDIKISVVTLAWTNGSWGI